MRIIRYSRHFHMRGGRAMLGNAEVLFVPRAACSATPKSCFFLGRHARQRRSLVCSSGGMLGNAEVLFLPRALIESKTFYRPQHVGFIERNIFSRPIT